MNPLRIAAGLLVLTLAVGACAGGGDASGDAASRPVETVVDPAPPTSTTTTLATEAAAPSSSLSPLAELVRPAGSLLFDPATVVEAARPVSIAIDGIGVVDAGVRGVGIEPNGELEVPGADEVGWYRWSASPGSEGSAVLAAHIAYNGVDGVFRDLHEVDEGTLVTIAYDDGTSRTFEVVETAQYRKDELPFDRVFAKSGDPVVALITCGGTFNRTLRSYDDNVVAYAVPV